MKSACLLLVITATALAQTPPMTLKQCQAVLAWGAEAPLKDLPAEQVSTLRSQANYCMITYGRDLTAKDSDEASKILNGGTISQPVTPSSTSVISQPITPTAADIYTKASPAVVLIELYNDKGEMDKSGSGFLISTDGRILTNYHVIAHSKKATVRLANKDAYDDLSVLDLDKRKDIALIKIKGVDLPHLELGDSNKVQVGDKVYSLSNPLGLLQNTLSDGIVSGIRPGDGYRYFQLTAPISHGSSGSPVFNAAGEVIGIAVWTIEEGQNLNFAVPIDYAKGMLPSITARSLADVYEPEPAPEKPAPNPAPTPAAAVTPSVPPEMKQQGSMIFLQSKLHVWTAEDARKALGDPVRHRLGEAPGYWDILAYPDPTRLLREVELAFDKDTHVLASIYGYPWSMTWDQCKQLWGDRVTVIKNPDGSRFYNYRDRNLHVLVTKRGDVVSIGVW